MALQLPAGTDALTRSAAYLDRAASWTRILWCRDGATTPGLGTFRTFHTDGDPAFTNPYIFLGSRPATDDLLLDVWDGVTDMLSSTFLPTASTWDWAALVYDSVGHTLTFLVDGAVIGPAISVDLSTFVFVETDQQIGGSAGDLSVAQIREWQAALSSCELAREAASPTPVRTADLLSATPLASPSDLTDPVGGHDWTATGAPAGLLGPSYRIPVGSLAFSGFGDAAMKFHTPAGLDLGAPPNAPWLGTAAGSNGCSGLVQLDGGVYGVTGAGWPFVLGDLNAAALTSQLDTDAPIGGDPNGQFTSIAGNYVDAFYGLKIAVLNIAPTPSVIELWKFDDTGAHVDTFALPDQLFPWIGPIAVDPSETVCYHALRDANTVYKQTLGGANAVFATEVGYKVRDNSILARRNGDVLILWDKTTAGASYVKHYDASGVLLFTYALPGSVGIGVLTPGLDDTSFFAAYYSTAATSSSVTVAEIEIGTGTILNSFDPDDGLGFEYDGPFCVVREQILLSIECPPITAGAIGIPYSAFLVAAGGTEPYTFSIASGALPSGLTLDAATGEISGIPTLAETQAFTIQVEDDDGTIAVVVCACSITITGGSALTSLSLPTVPGQVGTPYTLTPTTTGGTAPLVFSNCGGSHIGGASCLPPGLTLDTATGTIDGTPTVAGSWTIYVCVTDATGTHLQAAGVITIVPRGVPMTGFLSPDARMRLLSDLSVVLPGAKLHTYMAGTPSTPLATYSDDALTVPNTNPIIASAAGLFGPIYLTPGANYKFLLTDTNDVTVWTQDHVAIPINALAAGVGISLATVAGVTTISAAPRATSTPSSATPTPDVDTMDLYSLTALTAAAAFVNPTGTPTNGQQLRIRIKDDGTARALTWGTAYVAGGVALPTTTVLSKILTLTFLYNSDNALNKWQLIASAQEA